MQPAASLTPLHSSTSVTARQGGFASHAEVCGVLYVRLTLTTSGYVMGVLCVCLVVFTTRTELEQVSEMAEAEKPMTALLISRRGRSSY